MADYVFWYRGLRGPRITILRNRDPRAIMNEFERLHKIGEPVEIVGMNVEMMLDEAAHWYPLKQIAVEAE